MLVTRVKPKTLVLGVQDSYMLGYSLPGWIPFVFGQLVIWQAKASVCTHHRPPRRARHTTISLGGRMWRGVGKCSGRLVCTNYRDMGLFLFHFILASFISFLIY